ncbi:mandelate racemase/muconate lactonizing enzyme family protein [Paraconexibacter sp.]|uniref:mandelate racemase/muconate lactonizing enzyme family protein n=1 Tax=Paraconexibacter sp. TaxID=2949640 RepID=UPI0035664FB2
MDVSVERVDLPLRTPLRTAWGEVATRTVLLLSIRGEDGVVGRGEAASLEPYDGVPFAAVLAAMEAYADVLRRTPDRTGPGLMDACRRLVDLPQALAAVDMALWDRAGRREGRPVAALLTDSAACAVPVNATIGAEPAETAGDLAAAAAAAGFECVKVKVGVGDDLARVRAVREAGGDRLAIRLDANGAWGVEEAIAAISELADFGLELVEEPVHGIRELRAVRERVAVRIAMDETAAEPGAVGAGAADAVCLKISRCGGIGALAVQAALVRAAGGEAYLASTYDGPLGIAAAVHVAGALNLKTACGLATLDAFDVPMPEALLPRDGAITVPEGPGLGIHWPG